MHQPDRLLFELWVRLSFLFLPFGVPPHHFY
jgi:hypothetical protein